MENSSKRLDDRKSEADLAPEVAQMYAAIDASGVDQLHTVRATRELARFLVVERGWRITESDVGLST